LGLIDEDTYAKMVRKKEQIDRGLEYLESHYLTPTKENLAFLAELGEEKINDKTSLKNISSRKSFTIEKLEKLAPITKDFTQEAKEQILIEAKYHQYIKMQQEQIAKMHEMLALKIPEDLDIDAISGLSNEVKEKLKKFKPPTLHAASQISGITPAALEILHIYIKMKERGRV